MIHKKYPLAFVLCVVVVVVAIPSLIFRDVLTIWELYAYASDSLGRYLGISIWLNRGIVVGAMIPLLLVARYVVSFNSVKRRVASVVVATYACGYFVLMYYGTKDAYFTHDTGEAQKWVSIDANGEVRLYDTPGYDIMTGRALDSLTPQIAEKIGLLREIDMAGFDTTDAFFHPGTGAPLKWYSEDENGVIVIHNRSGFGLRTGHKLRPITVGIVRKVEEQAREAKLRKQYSTDSAVVASERADTEAKVRQLQERYLVMSDVKSGQSGRIGLTVVVTEGDPRVASIDRNAQDILGQSLGHEGFGVVINCFREPFFADGVFAELLAGNGTALARVRSGCIADFFVVGEVVSSMSESKRLEGTKSCRLQMNSIAYDSNGTLLSRVTLSATGLGFDSVTARDRAIDGLVPKVLDVVKALH